MNYLNEYEVDDYQDEPLIERNDYLHALDHLKGLIISVYQTGSVEDLEYHLEEILSVFNEKIPLTKPLMITQRFQSDLKNELIEFTRNYAEILKS